MKVLLDENLDHRLLKSLGSHDVYTASYMGWAGLKNGRLLDAAEGDGFDVLLTGDQSLYQEQNLTGRRLAIVVMSSVDWQIVKNRLRGVVDAIDNATSGSFQEVDCGAFSRKRLIEG